MKKAAFIYVYKKITYSIIYHNANITCTENNHKEIITMAKQPLHARF